MWRRFAKRLAAAIFTLLMLCVASFILFEWMPGDPVLARMHASGFRTDGKMDVFYSDEYARVRALYHRNKPPFYFAVQPLSISDSLYSIPHPEHRSILRAACIAHGSSEKVLEWYRMNLRLLRLLSADGQNDPAVQLVRLIMANGDFENRRRAYRALMSTIKDARTKELAARAAVQHEFLATQAAPVKSILPGFIWHGAENRFHYWLFGAAGGKGIVNGEWGQSLRDGQPVWDKLGPALQTTAPLALITIVLMYLLAIPIGVIIADHRSARFRQFWLNTTFTIYAVPSFWLGVLMLTFLCSSAYLNWFPVAYNLMPDLSKMNGLERASQYLYHAVLPITCWASGGAAFLVIQTFQATRDVQQRPFFLAARAKGLKTSLLRRHHIGPNVVIPGIGLLGGLIPVALSGAVAIEIIFSIPGMGQLIFTSFHTRDYPVVMAILLLIGIISILSTVLSDLLLSWVDPRIRKAKT